MDLKHFYPSPYVRCEIYFRIPHTCGKIIRGGGGVDGKIAKLIMKQRIMH